MLRAVRERLHSMSPKRTDKENDKDNNLEGAQDQGGKHGGQAGMPKPETSKPGKVVGDPKIQNPKTQNPKMQNPKAQHGIVLDHKNQEQPADKKRARQ